MIVEMNQSIARINNLPQSDRIEILKKKMLDEPHECAAVLQQIAAIRGAVNGLMREVIKGHLVEHIVHEGDEAKRETDLDVVLKVLDSYIK